MEQHSIVELDNGSIGVISEQTHSGHWRVQFVKSHLDVPEGRITRTLKPESYAVNDEIAVWPDLGIIAAINGTQYAIDVEQSETAPNVGTVEWIGRVNVPLWRVIRDNDTRIQRDDYGTW